MVDITTRLWLDNDMSNTQIFPKGTPTEFYGYNAPVVHINVESMGTVEVDEDDYYTPYEKFLVSIGQAQQVRFARQQAARS